MKQNMLCALMLLAGLNHVAVAANLHWKGVGGSGVGDFNVPANWQEGAVPGPADFAIIKNLASYAKNMAVTFNSDVTNERAEFAVSTNNYGLAINLNGYVWSVTNTSLGMRVYHGSGGEFALSNGTIRAPVLLLTPLTADEKADGISTNMALKLHDLTAEAGGVELAAALTALEDGSLKVANAVTIGKTGYGVGTLVLKQGSFLSVTNSLVIGGSAGATGVLENVSGKIEILDGGATIGSDGGGLLELGGGSFSAKMPLFAGLGTGDGHVRLLGGENLFQGIYIADTGTAKGSLLVSGGTNEATDLTIGRTVAAVGSMTMTDGVFRLSDNIWIGFGGKGSVAVSGGVMRTTAGVFCVGRVAGGTGEVTVAGGVLDVYDEFRLGGNAGSQGRLTLAGDGLMKVGYINEYTSGADSAILFDGGTLQARQNGALIRSVDDVRLTAKGLVLDTAGRSVSVLPTLLDATGEAGGITKTGAGTLTLAGTRNATGPVSVLAGTLVVSNNVSVAAGVSKINGAMTLTAENRMIIGGGAALAGTGTLDRVTFEDNALFSRDKADNEVSPLFAGDCLAESRVSVSLEGYSLEELKTSLPLIRMPSALIDLNKITVMLNGNTNPFLTARYIPAGGQQVLSVVYTAGTIVMVR
jgi:autotransporter-associated beta strand protein